VKRPPFKIAPSSPMTAQRIMRDGRTIVRSGRGHYVWTWSVLVPIATGVAPDGVNVRLGRDHPWHHIDLTADEAYALILDGDGPAVAGIVRLVNSHRRRNGLEVRP
jgi:hypothetical protein